MDSSIFWLLFLALALQPVIRQRMLEAARRRLITQIGKQRGTRVILLVHRQETVSILGFPLVRYIDIQDSEAVIHAIDTADPDIPLDIVLHTPGGLVLASYQIARALHRCKAKVTAFVPHYAMSGGTLIALGADEIVMSDHALLGPLDPQIGQFPAASLLSVLEAKPLEAIDDETLILADQARKAVKQLHAIVSELLADKLATDAAEQVARLLTAGTWTHDYPITCEQVRDLGLNVTTEMPLEVMQLMSLYPQPVRRSGGVEYGEGPVRRGSKKAAKMV
jgi:ClpP class serine protease